MKLLKDPLLHFLLLGAALFAAYALSTGLFSGEEARRVEIAASEIEFLAANFERQWGRPPTAEELERLTEARVREEILYREALAVGLDRNDVVVRRRMVQKMEMLTQDVALLADPTDEELRAFFEERREDYRIPPRLSFSHVYFNLDRRGPAASDDARRVLAELRSMDPPPPVASERGDSLMIDFEYAGLTPQEVRRTFGDRFAEALFELEPGWQGPIASGFGLHLVHVGERVEGGLPELDQVRERLVNDFNRFRRQQADEALYENLSERYEVVIADGEP
jgi:hypothetical protein